MQVSPHMRKILLFLFVFISAVVYSQQQKYDIVVDRNGTGHFRNIQQAIDSVRPFNPAGTVTIFIKKGVYKEKLVIPPHSCNIRLIGEDRDKTIINYDDHANVNKMGTFRSFTMKISGNDIYMENLTVENSSAPMGQAVSLHVEGDRAVFVNCRFLGHQDTIFTGKENMRQFFLNCYIEGTTDFIFGPSTAWFEGCRIVCKSNSYITAASTPQNIRYGYIFNKCKIEMLNGTVTKEYLGRPWRAYAMTLFMNCELPKEIAGWHNWGNPENEKTARYMEYNNSGEGADVSGRPTWVKVLTKKEAAEYTLENVLRGYDNWDPMSKVSR